MTVYEILSIIIGILTLLVVIVSLIVTLLTFLAKRNGKRKKIMPPLSAHRGGASQ